MEIACIRAVVSRGGRGAQKQSMPEQPLFAETAVPFSPSSPPFGGEVDSGLRTALLTGVATASADVLRMLRCPTFLHLCSKTSVHNMDLG